MKIEKVENLLTNLHVKTEYVIHIRNLKQVLIRLIFKKVHRMINFNQNAWHYWDEHRSKKKIILNKIFLSLENVRKHRDIKAEILNMSQQKEEETI